MKIVWRMKDGIYENGMGECKWEWLKMAWGIKVRMNENGMGNEKWNLWKWYGEWKWEWMKMVWGMKNGTNKKIIWRIKVGIKERKTNDKWGMNENENLESNEWVK